MIAEIITIIIGVIVVTLTTILVIYYSKRIRKIDISPNKPLVENLFRKQFTHGYTEGILDQILPRRNGCSLVTFYPTDVEQGENKPLPELQRVVVKNEYIIPFARGEYSPYREKIKLLGRDIMSLPEKMRVSKEGEWMTEESQRVFLKSTFNDWYITKGDDAIRSAMVDSSRIRLSKSALDQLRTLNRKLMELKVLEPKSEGEAK